MFDHSDRLAPTLILCLITALGLAGPAACQSPPDPPAVPPGMVLVDDMWLPYDTVHGDSAFTATPWPGGVVPYSFHASVSHANRLLVGIAMAEIEAVSQVRFVPWSGQQNAAGQREGRGILLRKDVLVKGDSVRFHPELPYFDEDENGKLITVGKFLYFTTYGSLRPTA